MPRLTRKIENDTELDPNIRSLMVTAELHVPPDNFFKGQISEDEIAEVGTRDKKTMLAMSIHAQWIDWAIDTIISLHGDVRRLDAENAKLRFHTKEQTTIWKILRFCVLAIAVGALSALGQWLIKGGN